MPAFFYRALDRSGKTVKGLFNASTKSEVVEALKQKALMPISVEQDSDNGFFSSFSNLFGKTASLRQMAIFTRQLSVLLKSGVPIDDSITLLIDQTNGYLKKAITGIREDLHEGKSLANSIEQYPTLFSNVYVYLVRAGEASGNLETILEKLADSIERTETVQNKVSEALRYPIFMLSMVVGVIIFASTVIVPSIAGTLQDLGGRMPPLTLFMMGLSHLFTGYWYFILAGLAAITATFIVWKNSDSGSLQFDTLLLKIPLISKFSKVGAVVQFSQVLGMLLDAGVNFSEALDLVSKVVSNKILSKALSQARSNIIKEGKIAKHLEKTNIFPPIACYMIKVGEESGQLSQMLLRVGKDYQEELFRTSDALVAALSPIMTILIAGVVLVIVLSIFLPIMEMSNIGQLSGM
jgi:type II secretory pathway component PulF